MTEKKLPFDKKYIESLTSKYPTPFYVYDENAIRENARKFVKAFSWAPSFKNYFAVKANPNPQLVKILKEEGFGGDCSSMAELVICERIGVTGENIMFTSNDTPADEYKKAAELNAIINLDDFSHIEFLEKTLGKMPELICFRYNPGHLREGNALIGKPEDAKYGFTREQILNGYEICKAKGVKRFGLHTMIASNELNADYFIETAKMLFELAVEIFNKTGIKLEFINLGGGIGIPYKLEQTAVNYEYVGNGIKKMYDKYIKSNNLGDIKLFMECGRTIAGPYGYLVSRVLHKKETYKNYIGLDACMSNLMRPALYGAYHHITVLGKENGATTMTYDITGSLCENNDKFAIDRKLPEISIGDIVVIHDAGAHGYAMGFNYNGKLRSAELLMKKDGTTELIRRAETLDDYFATMKF